MTIHDFAYRLRILRGSQGLSQDELAQRAHLQRKTVSEWERRIKKTPRATSLANLCIALQTTPEWLLEGEGPSPINNNAPVAAEASISAQDRA